MVYFSQLRSQTINAVLAYAFRMGLSFLIFSTAVTSSLAMSAPGSTVPKQGHAAKKSPEEKAEPWEAVWFKGSVEKAFTLAKKEHKPLFLYWGAIWCPPCAELKSQVFSKPRFAELMKPLVAVHLDGDSNAAQFWAERLHVSGYPTILLFDQNGAEAMRLSATVSMEEFEKVLESALKSSKSIEAILDLALAGKATRDDWQTLAYFSWSQAEGGKRTTTELLQTRVKLLDLVPGDLEIEKALLASSLLEGASIAADSDDADAKAWSNKVRPQATSWLDIVVKSAETIKACRSLLVYLPGDVLSWAFPAPDPARDAAVKKWQAATDVLAKDDHISVDNRLWASAAELAFLRLDKNSDGKAKDVPEPLKAKLKAAVVLADQRAVTKADRRSVISGAAYLLRDIGEFADARALLLKELQKTDTPWYYESSMAGLEKAAGNDQAALTWAEKARHSVKGRASKIQWVVEDLVMTAKAKIPDQNEQVTRLEDLTKAYYDLALRLPDGFSGRNATRAAKVAKELKPWLSKHSLHKLVQSYAAKCPSRHEKDDACSTHFRSLL